jgi:hypothetical protein
MAALIGAPAAVGRRSRAGLAGARWDHRAFDAIDPAAAGVRRLPAKLGTDVVGDAEIGGVAARSAKSFSVIPRSSDLVCARQGAERPAGVHRAAAAVNFTSYGRGAP